MTRDEERDVEKSGKTPLRILYLEDDPSDVALVTHELKKLGVDFILRHAATRDAYVIALREFIPEIVLSDHGLPSFDSLSALAILKEENQQVPFILVSGALGEERAIEILRSGVTDYVLKNRLSRLVPAVRRACEEATERAEHRRAEAALRESEERYMLAVRGANDGLWDWDLRTAQIYLSPRWKAMLGYEEHEIGTLPEEWLGRVHPEEREGLRGQIDAHLQSHTAHFEFEHRMRHRDGSYRWMLARGLAVRDQDSKAYRVAGSLTDITDRKKAEDALVRDALFDRLTNLPNRTLFENRLERAIRIASRSKDHVFAVLFLDVDRFKHVNDSLGHAAGDQLLCVLARRLQGLLRPGDTVTRFGGDEFAVLLEDIGDENHAGSVADRILKALSEPVLFEGQELAVTVSIGLVMNSSAFDSAGAYLRSADGAMYRAKSLGRARWEVFEANPHARAFEPCTLKTDLRGALERQEFVIHYQPLVSLVSGDVTACEALVRWNHPSRGLLMPATFVPWAEETGLIVPLGEWVLRTACNQLQRWIRAGVARLDLAVNLSARQLNDHNLGTIVTRVLEESGLAPERLTLELTESMVMGHSGPVLQTIKWLTSLGIEFSIDDFGTGYSSLAYLKHFPCTSLKIDRSFVRDITTDSDDAAIATAIISLAHNLRMKVVAEGIETEEQRRFLERERCDEGQGFLFLRPVRADQFLEFARNTRCPPSRAEAGQ
jgi:diguanylate cyclase (GGDEF)-like protein/PAS domain S-box-containing protein